MSSPSPDEDAPRRRTAPRLAAVLALAVAIGTVGSFAAPAPASAWDGDAPSIDSEAELVAFTNQSRSSAGLRVLTTDRELLAFARWRSQDMAERDYFSHDIPPRGEKVFDTMTADGYCFEVGGENIGWLGGGDDGAEAKIHQMFLDSPTHRAVLMGEAWDVMAVGTFKRDDGRKFWTVLFADRCDPAPAAVAGSQAAPAAPVSRRVGAPAPAGLLDSIVGGIAGHFLGS